MAFASFRRIFHPTREERIHDLKQIIELHERAKGKCSTCEYHIPPTSPGFITDFGSCMHGEEVYNKKDYGFSEIECPFYKEDSIDTIQKELESLEAQTKPDDFEQFILNRFERKV